MKSRLKDPDIARLFENTFPSTLDTTVKYFSPEQNLAFIITGVCAISPNIREALKSEIGYHVRSLTRPQLQ
jgi:meiotically up-regulated gene 157 (Mug157) protein